jgi:P4 family phage/plasmid primase-like protien
MSIHILGLRSYLDRKTGEVRTKESFFENEWRAPTVIDLFKNLEHYIEMIEEKNRYNLYYTAADVMDDRKGRVMVNQSIIPFDIDNADLDRLSDYIAPVCQALQVDPSKTAIICSGNGLQFIVALEYPLTYEEIFDEQRVFYKALCGKIDLELSKHMLAGNADVSVWSAARLLRLPMTENKKEGKETRKAYFIQRNLEPQDFNLMEASGMPILSAGDDYISDRVMSKFPDPDAEAVQSGCDFLKHCKQNPNSVSEPQWYAMLSILGRLPDGDSLCHEYSSEYEHYNESETEFKINQAITTSGPRTCSNISTLWDGCAACPNWGKCKSPISLTGRNHIASKSTGFYKISIRDNGAEVKIPQYEDLLRFFEQKHPFVTHMVGKMVYVYHDGVWKDMPKSYLEGFAEENFDPSPTNQMVSEFLGKMTRSNLRDQKWFEGTQGIVNFQNGVLNMDSRELMSHSPDYPFLYKLPFEYDPTAICPRFDQYLEEVTLEDADVKNVLLEFMGYTLAGVSPEIGQKALILTGEGSNGKSVLLDLLKYMAGEGNYASLYMGSELAKMENRYQLDGKLFNVSEEVPERAMSDSSLFKSLVTGGEVQARKLYCDSFSMKTNAKIIMACNDLPKTRDTSHGILRRLIIVPFKRRFTEKNRDIHLRKKIYAEASGIFNRAMEGLDRFFKQEQFTESKTIKKAVESYHEENDPLILWFKDTYEDSETENPIPVKEVYEKYKFAMEDMEERPMTMIAFSRAMARILGEEKSRTQKRVKGVTTRCFAHIRLIQEQDEQDF